MATQPHPTPKPAPTPPRPTPTPPRPPQQPPAAHIAPPQPQAAQHPTPAARGAVPPAPTGAGEHTPAGQAALDAPKPIGDQQALKTEHGKATAAERKEPPPVRTIADEQRERSDEIAKMGVEAYKRSIDQRKDEDKPKPVPGVGPLEVEERRPHQVEAHHGR
jgi:hypothetical protein